MRIRRRATTDETRLLDDEPEVVADGPSIAMIEKVCRQIDDQNIELAEISDHTTINNLLNELASVDRLDSMIDRAVKRLLMACVLLCAWARHWSRRGLPYSVVRSASDSSERGRTCPVQPGA